MCVTTADIAERRGRDGERTKQGEKGVGQYANLGQGKEKGGNEKYARE